MTLERSWQLPGQLTQDPLHGSDLTEPLGCTKSFDLQLHFDALSSLTFCHAMNQLSSCSLASSPFHPALWLGSFPKFGPQPLVVLLFVHSLPGLISPALISAVGLYLSGILVNSEDLLSISLFLQMQLIKNETISLLSLEPSMAPLCP